MKYIKIITLSLSLVILSAMTFAGLASAQSVKAGETITVSASETIDSMLFAGGTNINIAGIVNGDVYCAGQTITISGTVNGDVICAGQTLTVSGTIDGSVRLAGQTVSITGTISKSATVGAQTLTIDTNAVIGRDLLGGSQTTTINGTISRDIVAGANSLTVNGKIDHNIKGAIESFTVGSAGYIGGDVEYTGSNDPVISSGGSIVGKVTRTAPETETKNTSYAPMAFTAGSFVYMLVMMLILGAVLIAMFPRIFREAATKTIEKPGKAFLFGLSASVIAPVLIIMLFVSVVGLPLAVLTILTMIMLGILSAPFVGYTVGRVILPESKQDIWTIMAGISVLVVTFFIPIISYLTMFATYLFGTGMVLIQSQKLLAKPGKK